jgi:phage nucleotide-binding protein
MPPRLEVPSNSSNGAIDLVPNPDANMLAGLAITPAKELTTDRFNGLFYAFPGVGKTTIAGMFADYEPARDVLIVDCEGGASVLAHRDYVDVVQVRTWQDFQKVLTYLEREPRSKIKYNTVCFDNVTELAAMHLSSLVGAGSIEIQHYGMNTAAMMSTARKVRDLSRFRDMNTVLIAWQDTKENKLTHITRQTVALTEKLSARLPGVPNVVGHITIENNPPLYTRKLSFAASPLNDAKFRRSTGDDSTNVPDIIYYGLHQNPIADMLRTLYEGAPFPADQYKRPVGRTPTVTVGTAQKQAEQEQSESD